MKGALRTGMFLGCLLAVGPATAQQTLTQAVVLTIEGAAQAWVSRPGLPADEPLRLNQTLASPDRVRTGDRTRLTLQLADRTVARVGERSEFQVQHDSAEQRSVLFHLYRGLVYFFHRDRPDDLLIRSRTASAATRGTDFVVEVEESGRMILSLLDGAAELRSEQGTIRLARGEQGLAEPGRLPVKTAVLCGVQQIQWCLYYPGVLDPDDLPTPDTLAEWMRSSLVSYRRGNLREALAGYPADGPASSPSEAVYRAALLLSTGNAGQAQRGLESLTGPAPA